MTETKEKGRHLQICICMCVHLCVCVCVCTEPASNTDDPTVTHCNVINVLKGLMLVLLVRDDQLLVKEEEVGPETSCTTTHTFGHNYIILKGSDTVHRK